MTDNHKLINLIFLYPGAFFKNNLPLQCSHSPVISASVVDVPPIPDTRLTLEVSCLPPVGQLLGACHGLRDHSRMLH